MHLFESACSFGRIRCPRYETVWVKKFLVFFKPDIRFAFRGAYECLSSLNTIRGGSGHVSCVFKMFAVCLNGDSQTKVFNRSAWNEFRGRAINPHS